MRMTRRDRDIADARRAMRDTMDYLGEQKAASRDLGDLKESASKTVIEAAEVGLGAAAIGLAAGRLGTTSLGGSGIPLGLTLGVLGHAASMYGLAGKWGPHLQNVSNGAIAGWLTLWGAGQGGQWRQRAGEPAGPITSGVGHSPPPPQPLPQPPQYMRSYDQMGAAPVYPSHVIPPQRQFQAHNPFAGPAPYGRPSASPLSEAELQSMSRGMR